MNNIKGCINVVLDNYKNAPQGAILTKKGDQWESISRKDLFKDINSRLAECETLKNDFEPLKNANVFLSEKHEQDVKCIELLTKLVAYLLYERRVDNGELKESANDKVLIEKILANDLTDLPSELDSFIDSFKNYAYGGK